MRHILLPLGRVGQWVKTLQLESESFQFNPHYGLMELRDPTPLQHS